MKDTTIIVGGFLATDADDTNMKTDVWSFALDQRAFGPRRLLVAFNCPKAVSRDRFLCTRHGVSNASADASREHAHQLRRALLGGCHYSPSNSCNSVLGARHRHESVMSSRSSLTATARRFTSTDA